MMTGKDGAERAGVMIPIPQYPLYTATIAEYNAYPVCGIPLFNSSFLFLHSKVNIVNGFNILFTSSMLSLRLLSWKYVYVLRGAV